MADPGAHRARERHSSDATLEVIDKRAAARFPLQQREFRAEQVRRNYLTQFTSAEDIEKPRTRAHEIPFRGDASHGAAFGESVS
jgi:hypothetical protein